MIVRFAGLGMLGLAMALHAGHARGDETVPAAAAELHERILVLDTHLDTPSNLHRPGWSIVDDHSQDGDFAQVDLPRMKAGGLDGGFWVIYTAQDDRDEEGQRRSRDHGLARLAAIREMVAANSADFELAVDAAEAQRIAAAGKRVVFISMENASPLSADPTLLAYYQRMGLRMLGITHTRNNDFGDSSTDPAGPEWNGLSDKGRALVAEANRLGLVLDVSHASDAVFDQVLAQSTTPIIMSHTSADAIYDHPRNIDDERLRQLAGRGGVIHVNAYGGYLIEVPGSPERSKASAELRQRFGDYSDLSKEQIQEWRSGQAQIDRQFPVPVASLDDYMAHLLHILEVAGVDHVGIGADWDGGGGVAGLEDVSLLPRVTARLLAAGYSEADIAKIWSGNLLRLVDAAGAARARPEPGPLD